MAEIQKQIYITIPGQGTYPPLPDAGTDPWATFPDKPPSQPGAPDQGGQGGADPWSAFPDKPPTVKQAPSGPGKTFDTIEAGGVGARNAASFGFYPAIAGLSEAAGDTGQEAVKQEESAATTAPAGADALGGAELAQPLIGAAKMLHEAFSSHPDQAVQEAYTRGREAALADERLAQEQHPYAYLSGQLAGAIAAPGFGAGTGATTGARLLRSTLAGTAGAALGGAGEATSEGKAPLEVAKSAAANAPVGAAFGGAGSAALSAVEKGGKAVSSIVRGTRDANAEASRRVVNSMARDFEANGPQFTPESTAAAHTAGTPLALVDVGGENTRALARSAANTSPDARQALTELTQSRFENQTPRIAGFIREFTGGSHAAADSEALQTLARKANKPAYDLAYRAGDRQIFSPELERITGSPAVVEAMRSAATKGKNYAVNEGYGAFNPGVHVTDDGRVLFTKATPPKQPSQLERLEAEMNGRTLPPSGPGAGGGTGVPTYPNLQFWDYVQRELRNMEGAASRSGKDTEAASIGGLRRALNAELDRITPAFNDARRGAAKFFGAQDALEAGQKFVMSGADIREAAAALRKMNPAERELFSRGFASELANKVEGVADRRNVLNAIFLGSQKARNKIRLALGPERAMQLEALLRAETIVDEARKALGNSTTVRQLAEAGLAGGGAVAAYEGLQEHSFNPAHILVAALTVGAARHGAKIIDERVARRVGELLASNDPAMLAKGVKIVARDPQIIKALRVATGAGARVSANDIGPRNAAAGVGALGLRALGEGGSQPSDLGDQFYDQTQ